MNARPEISKGSVDETFQAIPSCIIGRWRYSNARRQLLWWRLYFFAAYLFELPVNHIYALWSAKNI